MKILFVMLFVLYSTCAHSNVQILRIEGDRDLVSIIRNNNRLVAQEFLALRDKDEIHVEAGDVKVILNLNDGSKKSITHQDSPFLVDDNTQHTQTLISNGHALLISFFSGQPTKTAEAISRGASTHPQITIAGMDLRNNIIPGSLENLVFFWDGGKPPYQITIYDQESDKPTLDQQVIEKEISIPLALLTGNYFHIEVKDKSGSNFADNQRFTIARASEVPSDILALEKALEQESYQLKVACLALMPEYKFYALQIAKANNDLQLMEALFVMQPNQDN